MIWEREKEREKEGESKLKTLESHLRIQGDSLNQNNSEKKRSKWNSNIQNFYRDSDRDLWFPLTFAWYIQDISVQYTEVVLQLLLWIKQYSDILQWLCVWSISNIYEAVWSHRDLTLTSLWPHLDPTLMLWRRRILTSCVSGQYPLYTSVLPVLLTFLLFIIYYIYYLHIVPPPPILCIYPVHVIRSVGMYTLLIQRSS